MELQISLKAISKYQLDKKLLTLDEDAIYEIIYLMRSLAKKINEDPDRDVLDNPERFVKASELNAITLIDEIYAFTLEYYHTKVSADIFSEIYETLEKKYGPTTLSATLKQYLQEFPSEGFDTTTQSVDEYMVGTTDNMPNKHVLLKEMLILWLKNMNPACTIYTDLFPDDSLRKLTPYIDIIQDMRTVFSGRPPLEHHTQDLIDMLRLPAIQAPKSLEGQLEYIRNNWADFLGELLLKILRGLDFLKEETKIGFGGPGPSQVLDFRSIGEEYERYSQDLDWMPNVVMLAKSIYVWLDQLSKIYQRTIYRLDQIPDEELDKYARWGINALWIIGLWERSKASKKIKHMCGNPEAEASAYSLYDYDIAQDLGGYESFNNLRDRAWRRGIRIASDMVPNHTGIDSKWMLEHPERFLSLDYPPYPSYTFNGPNLSDNPNIGIFIEDHYYNRTDAAVVFKHVDFRSGKTKYIYHGNDGTSMPWNDTAQLNYLNADVREAIIQQILHVARLSPIIRFDAAMVLTKRHIQRLWFPEPGSGGAIPSRSAQAISRTEFETLIPKEFWREVVDRIAQEVPDTLLLAEAFWLLEGYFVRTLGMHRVYNSAFMNMLKSEENSKYRLTIKNTLEFDPEVLKRFVNFMNNPDEDTAIAQFGKLDKYFGVCTMMVTMPGLPMIGHGQIEGFTEKYGMEYRRAYYNEQIDHDLVLRHEHEIFPLVKKRYLFSGVDNFFLYDFYTAQGNVNEDVFAYSNKVGNEKALIIYHNKYAQTDGWIKLSAAYSVKTGIGDERKLQQKTLGEGLALHTDENYYCIFRDFIADIEFIRNSKDIHEHGLFVSLGAYKYHVFLEFREVKDTTKKQYTELSLSLHGRGVKSIDSAFQDLLLHPIQQAFRDLINTDILQQLIDQIIISPSDEQQPEIITTFTAKLNHFLDTIIEFTGIHCDITNLVNDSINHLQTLSLINTINTLLTPPRSKIIQKMNVLVKNTLNEEKFGWPLLILYVITRNVGKISDAPDYILRSRSWIDAFRLQNVGIQTLKEFTQNDILATQTIQLYKILVYHQKWFEDKTGSFAIQANVVENILKNPETQQFLQVNRFNDKLWFNKEAFENLIQWLLIIAVTDVLSTKDLDKKIQKQRITVLYKTIQHWLEAEKQSEYQVQKLVDILGKD